MHARRPKVSQESTRLGLDRTELGAFPRPGGPVRRQRPSARLPTRPRRTTGFGSLGADLTDLAVANGHRTLRIVGKGNQPALIPPALRTTCAIDTAVGERTDGPLLSRADGSRLDRHAAGRIVRRLARRAGIAKTIAPHSLRHAAITAALDPGCSFRDVQDFARHADPRQTRRDDRARGALDHNPTYIVAIYLAGAATGGRRQTISGCRSNTRQPYDVRDRDLGLGRIHGGMGRDIRGDCMTTRDTLRA